VKTHGINSTSKRAQIVANVTEDLCRLRDAIKEFDFAMGVAIEKITEAEMAAQEEEVAQAEAAAPPDAVVSIPHGDQVLQLFLKEGNVLETLAQEVMMRGRLAAEVGALRKEVGHLEDVMNGVKIMQDYILGKLDRVGEEVEKEVPKADLVVPATPFEEISQEGIAGYYRCPACQLIFNKDCLHPFHNFGGTKKE